MKYKFAIALISVMAMLTFAGTTTASADAFNPNRIIDDAIFDNANSMSAGQRDALLNSFPNSGISPNSGFSAIDPNGYNPTNGYLYGGYVSAGQVIYDSAQAYGINSQVLLATLQKEQSLVVGGANYCNNGDEHKYAAALGYGCPDSGTTYSYSGLSLYRRNGAVVSNTGTTCVNSSSKAGFSQQLIRAAWLLKFGEQRSKGNVGWAVIKGSWNNSDDPQTCYGGPMTQGTFQRCPGASAAYYDGYFTIDNSSVHMDDGATSALYWYTPHFHGNQNFFSLFTGWFGSALLPNAFKIDGSQAIYIQAAGYRFYVPSIAVMQDFGFGSGAQTISQSTADNIPAPDSGTGLSSGLGTVVKSPSDTDADGGSIYLISNGRRYLFTTVQQMADFGFNSSNIVYLPLSFISSIPNAGVLSNYVQAPNYAIYQVSGDTKKFVLDGQAYASLNPTGLLSPVSNYLLDGIPSGIPISSKEALLGTSSGAIYMYLNSNYYYVPSSDVLECWGFMSTLGMQLYRLPNDNMVSPISNPTSLGCTDKVDGSTTYLLNGSNKILLPSSYGFSLGSINSDLVSVANKLATRSSALGQTIKSNSSPIVYYLESGYKKGIPSLTDLSLLGTPTSQIDHISNGAVSELPGAGLKMGIGQVVRASDTGTIYVITSSTTKSWIGTADSFLAYGYSWGSLNSFPSAAIDQFYTTNPSQLSNYLYTPSGGVYLIDSNGCYGLTSAQIDAYGQPHTSTQPYTSTIFPYLNFVNCKNASTYVKSPNSFTIYAIIGGIKYPISTWAKLQSLSGQSNPSVILLSDPTLASFASGTVL